MAGFGAQHYRKKGASAVPPDSTPCCAFTLGRNHDLNPVSINVRTGLINVELRSRRLSYVRAFQPRAVSGSRRDSSWFDGPPEN
jgi:hypothetical protein